MRLPTFSTERTPFWPMRWARARLLRWWPPPWRSKRLGLCRKSLFAVPNHLVEQWASEFLCLYPAANIPCHHKKDFEARNRKTFCAKIATGDYDAVIMGHTQFEGTRSPWSGGSG